MKPIEHSMLSPLQSVTEGLPFQEHGLLHCIDDNGKRITAVTEDVEYHRMLAAATPEQRAALVVPAEKYPRSRPGWPDEWIRSAS